MNGNSGWRDSARKVYLYIILFLILYSLWVGLRMAEMLGRGEEIPGFFRAAHTHILCNSFLLLFLLYDLRIKDRVEKLSIHWGLGEIILGIGLLGHILISAGFSAAAFDPASTRFGMAFAGAGEAMLLYSLLAYILVAILAEMYK